MSSDDDNIKDQSEGSSPERPEVNFTETKPVFKSQEHDKLVNETLCLPALNEGDFTDVSDMLPRVELATGNDEIAEWVRAFQFGRDMLPGDTTFRSVEGYRPFEAIDDKDADFKQYVDSPDGRLSARKPKLAQGGSGNLLSGQNAMMKMNALMSMGTVIQVPLWHTGIWVSLKAPSESALLELDRRIAREKALMGRRTRGTVFSNSAVYTKKHIFNMVISHVFDCNLKDWTPALLADTISILDLPLLTWGILCTIYTSGYPYSRACINENADCNHVVKETLDITKILWTDNKRFTDAQRTHMHKGSGKVTLDEVAKYKADFESDVTTVQVHDSVAVELRIPTAQQFFDVGQRYVDDIETLADKSFEQPLKGRERAEYLSSQGGAVMLRRHSHWIKRILMGENGDEGIIAENDRETIDAAMGNLSTEPDYVKAILKGIAQYMEEAVVSLTAIPSYKCPACGGYQKDVSKRFPYLIPIEVDMVFFTLTRQRFLKTLSQAGSVE